MRKAVVLAVLAALLACACAETGSNQVANRAALCATCGAAINQNYFMDSADKAMGPGSY